MNRHGLRLQEITPADQPLASSLDMKNWVGGPLEDITDYDEWVINEARNVILISLGGGSHEIPSMYDLFYKGRRIRIESGGDRASSHLEEHADGSRTFTVFISLAVPLDLKDEYEHVRDLTVEAFAALYPRSEEYPSTLVIDFV